jgi:uncharacterized membrane protein
LDDSYQHGFTLSGGTVTDLGTLPYGDGSRHSPSTAMAMVVGAAASVVNGAPNYPEDPFIYQNGVMTGLGNLGGPWGAALSVNDLDRWPAISGWSRCQAFPASSIRRMPSCTQRADARDRRQRAGLGSRASDVNNLGQVVGSFRPGAAVIMLPVRERRADGPEHLIDPASGWTITGAPPSTTCSRSPRRPAGRGCARR